VKLSDLFGNGKKLCEKTGISRNICSVSSRGRGAEGMVTNNADKRCPATKYKRSKIVFAVSSMTRSLGHLRPRLLEFPLRKHPGGVTWVE